MIPMQRFFGVIKMQIEGEAKRTGAINAAYDALNQHSTIGRKQSFIVRT
jgi:hypothetical protein